MGVEETKGSSGGGGGGDGGGLVSVSQEIKVDKKVVNVLCVQYAAALWLFHMNSFLLLFSLFFALFSSSSCSCSCSSASALLLVLVLVLVLDLVLLHPRLVIVVVLLVLSWSIIIINIISLLEQLA